MYLKGHGGSRLDVSELEEASCHMSITIEKSPQFILELWELCFIWITLIVFAVKV
jgi:hypothetical protein